MLAMANNPNEEVRQLQRRLWMCAKQSRRRPFQALYDRIYRSDVLWEAWNRVRGNGGAAGGEVGDRADLRGGFSSVQLWIPSEEKRDLGSGSIARSG